MKSSCLIVKKLIYDRYVIVTIGFQCTEENNEREGRLILSEVVQVRCVKIIYQQRRKYYRDYILVLVQSSCTQ